MNAIQYGAQAGALGQIAQGRALRSVHGTDSAGFEASYSKTAYMNAHQSLSFQKGSAQAYDAETHGGNIRTAESMGRVSNATQLKTHTASLANVLGSEDILATSQASLNAEKSYQTAVGFGKKVQQGAVNVDGSLVSGGSYKNGLTAQTEESVGKSIGTAENFISSAEDAATELKKQAHKRQKDQTTDTFAEVDAIATGAKAAVKKIFGNGNTSFDDAYNGTLAKHAKNNALLASDASRADEILEAVKDGDFTKMGKLSSSNKFDMAAGGMTASYNVSNGSIQGGAQSGVSYSHNESRSFSYGVSVSGGSALAAAGMSMGMSAQGFANTSSAIAAAGQVMSTASMVGRVAGGISSLVGGASGDALMAAQQGVQRASARVSSAQSQFNFATEQAAASYPKGEAAYSAWNAQQVGAESARLQMGIHDMNASVGRLNGIKSKLIDEGVNKFDPRIKSLNRRVRKLNSQILQDGMRVKYLGYRNNQINAEHNLAQAQLEESFARMKLNSL